MPYLLDANSLITAKNDAYRFAVCPGFWEWLDAAGANGRLFSIDRIRAELLDKKDDLTTWAQQRPSGFFLATDQSVAPALATISQWASTSTQYTPASVAQFLGKADYFLIAHALARGYTIVTHEISQPDSKAKIKIPDACNAVGVAWLNTFQMLENEGARFVLAPPTAPLS